MALRSKENNNRKMNRAATGRSRSKQDVIFDLRGENESASERPYREKHRVEVEENPRTKTYDGFTEGRDLEAFPYSGYSQGTYRSENGSGRGSQRAYRSEGGSTSNPLDSYQIDSSKSRVLRGNAPGMRRVGSNDAGSVPEKEISADLFVKNSNSGGRQSRVNRPARSSGTYRTYSRRPSASDGNTADYNGERRRQDTGIDAPYSAPWVPKTAYRTGNSKNTFRPAGSGGRSQRTQPGNRPDTARYQSRERDFFYEMDLPGEDIPLQRKEYEETGTESSQERLRRREQKKQEREQQLRNTFFRMGAAAAVGLLLFVMLITFVVIRIRSKKDDTVVTAIDQTEQETPNPSAPVDTSSSGEKPEGNTSGEKNAQKTAEGTAQEDTAAPDSSADKAENTQNTSAKEGTGDNDRKDLDGEKTGNETPSEGNAGTESEGDAGPGNGENTDPEGVDNAGTGNGENTVPGDTDNTAPETGQISAPETESPAGISTEPQTGGYSRQDEWNLILVNPWNKLPEGYIVQTTNLLNGESVDSRCYSDLTEMLEACVNGGGTPIVCSSYRSHDKQVLLYDQQVNKLMSEGMTREQAEKEAGTVVAVPGTSEHEIGLAVDICDSENQMLDESQAQTATQQWLMANSWKYGFILRYPPDKGAITGIIYEPWHYRYVGREAAMEIYSRGICLEEYLAE